MDMINTIDEITYELMIKLMSSGMTNFMLFMSHLGSAITLIVLTIAFILLLKNKTNSKFIAINLVLVFVINRILKLVIARPRPEVLQIVHIQRSKKQKNKIPINSIFIYFNIINRYK